MLKTIKITHPEHDVWFLSDLHWGHNRDFIWGKRGFASVEEHDETLVHRWNAHLTNRSVAVHVGDLVFADPDGERFKTLVRRLSFNTLYVGAGNHISGHVAVYKEAMNAQFFGSVIDGQLQYEVYPLVYLVDGNPNKRVIFMPVYFELSVGGHHIVCCHYPILSFNKQSKGSTLITGHSHGSCQLTNKDTGLGRRLDVGVESFGRPISLTEVKRHLNGRTLDLRDHHSGTEATP